MQTGNVRPSELLTSIRPIRLNHDKLGKNYDSEFIIAKRTRLHLRIKSSYPITEVGL